MQPLGANRAYEFIGRMALGAEAGLWSGRLVHGCVRADLRDRVAEPNRDRGVPQWDSVTT
jgi:hypothetical protein